MIRTCVPNQTWMTTLSTCCSPRTDGNSRTSVSYNSHLPPRPSFANLFFKNHHRTSIEQLLNSGTTVLCDRYAFSGIAFSASKGLPFEWCRAPDVSLPAPDLTLFLDISPEKAKERGGYGEERYEKEEMQRKVKEFFDRIGREMVRAECRSGKWVVVDAGLEKNHVADAIWEEVQSVVTDVGYPVQRLWQNSLS